MSHVIPGLRLELFLIAMHVNICRSIPAEILLILFSSIFPYFSAAMPVSRAPMAIEDKKQAVLMAEAFKLKRVALLGGTFENQIEN
jgi:hypothetical protein